MNGAEWDCEMLDPVISLGARHLLADGVVPAHISTTLMFTLLKKRFGLKAEMLGDPDLQPDSRAVERWRLVPLDREGRGKATLAVSACAQ